MKSLLLYFLQVIVASGILYAYYHFVLRNKRFHQYNRFYLLAAAFISVLVPFLHIPVYFAPSQAQSSVVLQTLQNISYSGSFEADAGNAAVSPGTATSFNWNIVLYTLYTLAALLFLIRILVSLKKLRFLIRNNPVEELEGVHFVNTTEPGTPYSFFRWLFWNKKIELQSEKGGHIFRHEVFHIQQKHSIDILAMELLTVFFWINPFFHLVKKELKAIHEFLADQFVADETKKWEYAELLLMQALNTHHQLVNPFFHNQIKRRIAMITNPEKTSHRYLRKLLVLPVTAIVVTLFAFKYKSRDEATPLRSTEAITIVVDAAHGGTDPGVKSIDKKYTEAQLTLELAKAIQRLAKEYNINVVMTREDANFPGNASTTLEGLKKRIEISEMTKPAAFISLHMNAMPAVKTKNGAVVNKDTETGFASGASGIDAYVTGKKIAPRSKLLASAILQNVTSVFPANQQPMERHDAGIYVLDNNNYPAVILQCGYITNEKDLGFIIKPENQEKLARSILNGIASYSNQAKESPNGNDTLPKINQYPNALIVIDRVIRKEMTLSELDKKLEPDQIESMSLLKGVSATDKYGEKGKEGVIEIVTKAAYTKAEATNKILYKITDDDRIIFEKVEIEPAFPGGEASWKKYLETNLNASLVEKGAPAGTYTVFIQFVVRKDGSTYDVKALTNFGFGMEAEALRVIKKVPKWLPAIQNGRSVNAYKKQPVNFVVGNAKTTRNLPLEKIRNIVQGKTTLPEIRSLFGDPTSRSMDIYSILWAYNGGNGKFTIQFNKTTETVAHFQFIGVVTPGSMSIDEEKAKKVKENETTFAQVERFFGKPSGVQITDEQEAWLYEGAGSRLMVMTTDRESRVVNYFSYINQ